MRPTDSALGILRSPDPDLCVPGRRILRPREPCYFIFFSVLLTSGRRQKFAIVLPILDPNWVILQTLKKKIHKYFFQNENLYV